MRGTINFRIPDPFGVSFYAASLCGYTRAGGGSRDYLRMDQLSKGVTLVCVFKAFGGIGVDN